MAYDKAEFEKFLRKVDDVESIIKGLSMDSKETVDEAMKKSDEFLKKFTQASTSEKSEVNRTMINQKAFDELQRGTSRPNGPASMDPAMFMSAMEEDCRQRSERRRQRKQEAEELKVKANEHFQSGDFQKAVELYTEALTKCRDWTVLYTNRCQAYLRLQEFNKALEDCDWALKIDERCLKALVLQAKAYEGLGDYERAMDSYEQARTVAPEKIKLIDGYIKEMKLRQQAKIEEDAVTSLAETGDLKIGGLVELLTRVNQPLQQALFYLGGLNVISGLIVDVNDQTLFRTQGGLDLHRTHPYISQCFTLSSSDMTEELVETYTAYLTVTQKACHKYETNQVALLSQLSFTDALLKHLKTDNSPGRAISRATLELLVDISQTENGLDTIVTHFKNSWLFSSVLHQISVARHRHIATDLLTNLSSTKRFQAAVGDDDSNYEAIEIFLGNMDIHCELLPTLITCFTKICEDTRCRQTLSTRPMFWQICLQCIVSQLVVHTAQIILSTICLKHICY